MRERRIYIMMSYIDMFLMTLKLKAMGFLKDEKGEVSIVSMVVLIGVAVLLAIVFKDAIGDLIQNLLDTIETNASDVVNQKIQ